MPEAPKDWYERVSLYCSEHDSIMRLTKGKYSYYYACKDHCRNHISIEKANEIKDRAFDALVNQTLQKGSILKAGKYTAEVRDASLGFLSIYINKERNK